MKHNFSTTRVVSAMLFLALLANAGCLIQTHTSNTSSPSFGDEDPATAAEINAAAGLDFDNNRLTALQAIAARPGLSVGEQIHLVHTAYERLNFDNQKVALLTTIIKNPAFCRETKQVICDDLGKLAFDTSRQTVLQEIARRETATSPASAPS